MAQTFGCKADEALTVFSALSEYWNTTNGMVLQTAERIRTCKSSVVRDVYGVKISGSERQFDFKDEMTATWKAGKNTTIARFTDPLYEDFSGWCFDELSISTAKGEKATLTAKAHAHRLTWGGTIQYHQEPDLPSSTSLPSLPAFGWFGASTFGLAIGVAAAGLQSGVYTVKFLHADAYNLDGNWLCGKTHGAVATATFEAIDDTDWTTPSGWTRKTDGRTRTNSAHGRRTAIFEKVIF